MSVTLFISDLHLSPDHPEMTDCFVRFLQREAERTDALYILGDLFEAWVGDDVNDDFTRTIKDALKKWPKPLYLMQGNRDFLMGKQFAQETHAELLPDPTVINLYGNAMLVTHGDLLCANDKAYLRYRWLVHRSVLQKLFLLLPLKIRLKIAEKMRQRSMSHVKTLSPDVMDVAPQAVNDWLKRYKVSHIIHGHTHRPSITLGRMVLPAWHERGGALAVGRNGASELIYFT